MEDLSSHSMFYLTNHFDQLICDSFTIFDLGVIVLNTTGSECHYA